MSRNLVAFLVLSTVGCISPRYALTAGEVECADKPECWPEGSAMRMGLEARRTEEGLRSVLKQKHEELVALFSERMVIDGKDYFKHQRLVEAIRAQEKAWESYKLAECELVGARSTAASAWQSTKATECDATVTADRIGILSDAIECLKKLPADDRVDEAARCMKRVTPMAPEEPDEADE